MLVIDGDGHLVEPPELWSDYVPTGMRDRIRLEPADDGLPGRLVIGEYVLPLFVAEAPFGYGDSLRPGGLKPGRVENLRYGQSEPGGWDAHKRLEVHDAEDIVAAVMFPTIGLHFGSVTDPEVAVAACQAYNRWAADYASAAPDELLVIPALPGHFPELAAQELRRCVEEYGAVGAGIRPNPTVDGRKLDHPDFEILWSTAEDLDVPICCHNIAWRDRDQLAWDRNFGNFITLHTAVHPLEAMVAFSTLYQGGVFERHPGLRVGLMEATCGWVPFWLERLHEHWEQVGWLVGSKEDPREVFRQHCIVGCEGEEEMVPYVQERFGNSSVLWASDYPHFDTEAPFTADMLERTDMTEAQLAGVMHEAAVDFYRLDWDRIVASNAKRRGLARVGAAG